MKIETKLAFKMMQKNIKRTLFTIIAIILCATILFTAIFLIASIKNGITENINTAYNDYHILIRNINIDSLNKIKEKEYIDKIYLQEEDKSPLEEIDKNYHFKKNNNFNIFIKYNNARKVCDYSTDIIKTLGLNIAELKNGEKLEFNQRLLTTYGLIDIEIVDENHSPVCRARVNYSYVIYIIIAVILVVFCALFIIILYNAFLITINERKKEYAVISSVGGTEKQILKMIFIEGLVMGIIAIVVGGFLSFLFTNIILDLLNNIVSNTGYHFRLIFEAKYLILSLFIIVFNIFISSIIPSIRASTTSVMQDIRNNKQIKYKRKNTILEKILSIEGKLAIKNIKRNKSKYKTIVILLVVCMTSYITVSTYINYEKVTAELVNEYDVDAELRLDTSLNIDYITLLKNYENIHEDNLDFIEYKITGLSFLVEPEEALITNNLTRTYENGQKSIQIVVIGLDNTTYLDYIHRLNGNNGDAILYNNTTQIEKADELKYVYSPVFKEDYNLALSIIATDISNYEIVDNEILNSNIILTDELMDGFKDIQTTYGAPTIFVNMDTFNRIEKQVSDYVPQNNFRVEKWIWSDTNTINIRIKCNNIIEFSNYIADIAQKQNMIIDVEYYTLENQEKIIYIAIVQLILRIIIISIIVIGIISSVNIISASLWERKQEFNLLNNIGATKNSINRILIYECVYLFFKASIISIILSIPILYGIIKYMENIIVLNKLLIPFGSIGVFFLLLFILSLLITKFIMKSTKVLHIE